MGAVGLVSAATPSGGVPYTAAVDEKTKCFTPASRQHCRSERVEQVLLP